MYRHPKPYARLMRLFAIILVMIIAIPVSTAQIDADQNWDQVARAVWPTFRNTPHMIDTCALKIAHEQAFDQNKDWPAYCNMYKETSLVRERVSELRNLLEEMKLSKLQREQLARGQVAIGATAKLAELGWGRPEKINRTVTASGTTEQWVYPGRSYLYVTNGRVTGIQN
jgi:hypothetical protein